MPQIPFLSNTSPKSNLNFIQAEIYLNELLEVLGYDSDKFWSGNDRANMDKILRDIKINQILNDNRN